MSLSEIILYNRTGQQVPIVQATNPNGTHSNPREGRRPSLTGLPLQVA